MTNGELLVDHLLGQLDPVWAALLEQHRESCRRCARRGPCPTARLAARQRQHVGV